MKKSYWSLLLILPVLMFSACGKKNDDVAQNGVATTCSPGQVLHPQYGCLQPSPQQQGYGIYNGQSVPCNCWSGTVMSYNGCQQLGQGNIPGSYPNQYPNQYPNGQYPYPYPQQGVGGLPGNLGLPGTPPMGFWFWTGYSFSYRFHYYY